MYFEHWCTLMTDGYGLDGGGYSFEPVNTDTWVGLDTATTAPRIAVWEGYDPDYFPFCEGDRSGGDLLVRPLSRDGWPQAIEIDDGIMVLVGSGRVVASDRECWCCDDTDSRQPYPGCEHCEGDGYIEAPACDWAVYRRHQAPSMTAACAAYLAAALWSSCDDHDEPLDQRRDVDYIHPDSIASAEAFLLMFMEQARALGLEVSGAHDEPYLDASEHGHNAWMSRNGHGVGYFTLYDHRDTAADRARGNALQALAKSHGDAHVYVGDDGWIHIDDERGEASLPCLAACRPAV